MDPQTCARCGEPLPQGARFCPNCGAPVSVPPASERRVVTVAFADLAASTELASHLDPERFREVLAAFHEMASDRIEALGGRAEGFIGDAVLGVFGVPIVHDDDAVRGIRAALQIVDGAERIGSRLGLPEPLRVRAGVNTGPVAVGTASDRNLVIGAQVNAGARLQQAAEPGEVLVGATTHQLAVGNVEFGDERRLAAKGFDDELRVWPALRMTPRSSREAIALVDRRRELALLDDTFERVRERSRAHLVTLLGEPGIGKTRVVQEFLSGLPEDVRVMEGRSSPFEEEVTFLPLAQMVYRAIGEERGASDEVVLARLRALVDGGADDPDLAIRRLGFALGLGEEGSEENRYHAAEVRSGVLTLVTGLAADRPVVIVFEDVHEADPLLLDLIEQLVKEARRLPLMVVCVARWEFLQDQPGWAGGIPDAVMLWVESLSPEDAVELAMAAGDLPADEAQRVAEHAGGNPFFLVEITSMLRREGRGLSRAGVGGGAALLPPTVQAVVAARIDQLSPGARELVRRAAVFPLGRFDQDELSIIAEPRKDLLAEAEEDELLVADGERPGQWRFRSDVLRDVAYESLAKRERQRLHLRVANKLSETDEADRYPRTVAYHLEHAALAALDLNPDDRTLAERAVEALSRAGDIARQRIESRAAADLYERALALAGDEAGWDGREGRILSMQGEARYWLGEFDEAEESLRRALALDGGEEVEAHAARFLADISLTVRGDDHLAAALFDRALVAARRLGSPYVLARTLLMAAWVPYRRGEPGRAEAMFREALEVARGGERPDAWAVSRALSGLATTTSMDGDERVALDLATEGLEIGEAAGQAFTAAIAHGAVASSLRRLLRLDEALEHDEAAIRTLRELGARWELASALGDRGATHRLAGRPDDAEQDLREALVLCRDLKERALVGWTAAELARLLATGGDTAGARATLDEPVVRTAAEEPGSATALLVAEAVLALAEGDRQTAAARSTESIEIETDREGAGNMLAAQIWWTGRLFGPDAAGGSERVEQARERLHHNGWNQALREPDLVADLTPSSTPAS